MNLMLVVLRVDGFLELQGGMHMIISTTLLRVVSQLHRHLHGIGITAGPSPSPYTAQTKMARKDSVWYLCTVMHILLAVVLPLPISDHREDDEVCLLFGPSDFGQGTDDERERGKEDEGSGFGLDACMDVNEGRGEHVNARTDGRRKEGTTMNGNCSTLLREAIFSSLSELLRRSTYPLHPIPHTPSPTSSAFSSSAPFSSSSAPSSSSSIHSSSFTSSSMFLSPHTAQSPNSSPQPPDREVLIPSSITEGVNSGEGHVHTSLLLPRACVDECGEIEEGICLVDPGDGVTQVDGRGVTETSGNPPTQNTRKRKRTVLEETHEDMQEAIQNKRNVRRRVEGDEHSTFEQRRMKRRKEMSELEREMILAVIERVWLCV
ncbi:hypothetical protein K474DRAFT_1666237 [Panus rudis PR-1116 ss-1]|nr:hypothetical protein K474DRAFT_1666237 [Panus rudis PR-1116 ss-1]